jgi:hypothetical protein
VLPAPLLVADSTGGKTMSSRDTRAGRPAEPRRTVEEVCFAFMVVSDRPYK